MREQCPSTRLRQGRWPPGLEKSWLGYHIVSSPQRDLRMPIYEYVCTACGAESEILQRMSDDPERICPACGAEALVKQVSAAGFRLKGKGWYETDFKSDNRHNLVGDDTAAKPADAKKDEKAKSDGSETGTKPDKGGAASETKTPPPASKPAKPAPAASGTT